MSTKKLKVSDGDWVCADEECGNLNFARRDKCNKCGEAKSASTIIKSTGHEIGPKFAEKSKGLFSADDWQCSKCGNINWARRNTCNVCNAPKVGPEELRTGYGGGFKENENVTYKEKEDSDGEFDEFGRKKKKFRGKLPDVKSVVTVDTPLPAKKESLALDDEEDDEDDDEDVDLSKYALSSDDDESAPPPQPKVLKRKSEASPISAKRNRSRSRSSSSSAGSSTSNSSSSDSRRSPSPARSHSSSRSQQSSTSRSPKSRSRSRSPRRRSRSPHYSRR